MIAHDLQPLARSIDELKLLPNNPRKGDIEAVMRSYQRFGQRKPIVALKDGTVIAGNHQLQAAQRLGWTQIAVVTVNDDESTAQAFALADNRTADLGSYDNEALAEMLQAVAIDPELLSATGYDDNDVKALLAEIESLPIGQDEQLEVQVPATAPSKTIKGDIWILGNHRLMCGDCREPSDVDKLMNNNAINLAFTSPPYAEQRTYDETSGFKPIPPDEYVQWFEMVQANVAAHLAHDGSWFVNIKPASRGLDTELYVMDLVIAHPRQWGWHFASELCWERTGIPQKPHKRFKNQYELIFQFAFNEWKFHPESVRHESESVPSYSRNNHLSHGLAGAQGSHGKWENLKEGLAYPGNRLPTFVSSHEITGHTAAFPVGLPEFFVKAYTDEGDNVYDPFMGSGSTLLAAHNQHRVAFGMEISPAYCDIICKRFQQATGIMPIAEATGNEHNFLED
jgi:DNA modification methylase